MCGIFAVFGLKGDPHTNRKVVYEMSKKIRHRGPDWSSIWVDYNAESGKGTYFSHERLAIVDPSPKGDQPFIDEEADLAWIVNGEIYNHVALEKEHGIAVKGGSDCEVVGGLYQKYGTNFVDMLDGMFALCLEDKKTGTLFAARDPMGIAPLFMAYGKDGSVWFASEMKCFVDNPIITKVEIFPPGHQLTITKDGESKMERWYNPSWLDADRIPSEPLDYEKIREVSTQAVAKRLMADVPFGVLLSGGLDSSLVSAISARIMKETNPDAELHSFCIGIKGAPDLAAAKAVADFVGTTHHEFYFTPEQALDVVKDVVWHIESYEQIRASTPMFLLARKIKAMGIKMVLSGEGADETMGGYLYFHKAPDAAEFHRECVRKTTRLHQWDVNRANKSCFAWGLESRVPFLDKKFLEVVMNLDPAAKMIDMKEIDENGHPKLEKYVLRKAFEGYLPESVLYRQKEQFSDGVGYDWVDGLKDYAEIEVTDEEFADRKTRFPDNPPETKEYYMLRSIFEDRFVTGRECGPSALATVPTGKSIACSTPEAICWDPEWEKSAGDISGRAVGVHVASEDFSIGHAQVSVGCMA